jgi:NAD(P)-dependent dehydrogenase (short-subunit alcohol dehydrogenase family)
VEKFIDDLAKAKRATPAAMEKEFFTTARPTSLLKRFATPDEVAALVAFVASALSSATNGAALRADGGVVRSIL